MAMDLAENISHKTSGLIQSSNHRDLLDIVDTLRNSGVSHYVDLPQIIVCGSQSSGKSSTLESLSGIAFPTAEGLCTRFATELILRRGETDKPEIKVQIQPAAGRTGEERIRLAAFSAETSDQNDFAKIIESAKEAMSLSGREGSKIFSTDVLRIESTSPTAPNITLVDLPGLFGASDKNQSDDDATLVQELVVGYMRQRRSIILAVVTADNPFANQPVTKSDVQSGIKDCRRKLTRLGRARSTKREKHTYLQRISSQLSKLIRAGIDGVYADKFYESYPGQADAFDRRLRAHVQWILSEYADKMREDGHSLEIVEEDEDPVREISSKYIMRVDYLEIVSDLMVECRGRELPGTFNPMVVGDMFSRQCKPWEPITQNLVERIHDAATTTFNKVVSEICDQNTRSRLMRLHMEWKSCEAVVYVVAQ
ncbi:Uu.00g048920.m01.CDS01 [Anthostomella pinea]|uniref:Uu.00g048920.m01.CDS01 n=1 Tax=Anthostomella pinea TaxID=933095 RepID=A0AAI8VBT9_9PEZI|nr:Uu.00g048920.m01.CDS01 [Anthostomella pinea]